jgi:hypothetical protein
MWRRELWWSVVWLVWGTLCSIGIGLGDQSIWAGIVWLAGSSAIAVFGQPLLMLYMLSLSRISSQSPWPNRRCRGSAGLESNSPSLLFWLEDEQLSILDPNRKWWSLYLPIVFTVAPIHGIWAGSIVGLAAVLVDGWPKTAMYGAIIGCLGGIAAVIVIYGVLTALFIASRRGPSIDRLREIVRKACDEAERLQHDTLHAGHLFLAVLRSPTGAVARLIAGKEANIAEARRYVAEETARLISIDNGQVNVRDEEIGVQVEPTCASDVFALSIEEARTLRHAEVESGHLLLGLLASVPELTTTAIGMLGVPTDDLWQRIVDCI